MWVNCFFNTLFIIDTKKKPLYAHWGLGEINIALYLILEAYISQRKSRDARKKCVFDGRSWNIPLKVEVGTRHRRSPDAGAAQFVAALWLSSEANKVSFTLRLISTSHGRQKCNYTVGVSLKNPTNCINERSAYVPANGIRLDADVN